LTIQNDGIDNFGSVTIGGGTLQIGGGDVAGDISTLNITDNGSLVINRSGTIGLSSTIAGSGSLSKVGNGTLVLSGDSSYSGATTLTQGGLQVDGNLSGNGAFTTASGTLLSGHGTIAAPITASGTINPGLINTPGLLAANGGLTLSSGSTVTFDLIGPSTSDAISVAGDLHLNNNTVTANFLGIPQPGTFYPVFTYSGTLFGGFDPNIAGSHFTMALDTNSSPGTVYLEITGGTGANLVWSSAGDSTWNSTTPNWTDLNTTTPGQSFFSGDNVQFDDTSVTSLISIPSGVSVFPAAITNISDINNFVITGGGKISGTVGIIKGGASMLTLSNANDFSGLVDIQGGILRAGNNTALGSAAVGTTVEAGATLDVNGQTLGGEVITISGFGLSNTGAVINTAGIVNTAFRSLVLASNASIGGTGQWAVNNSGGNATVSSGGLPWTLTKVGPNLIGLQNLSSVDPALGNIEVAQGTLDFNGLTASMGDPNYTNIVDSGATVQFTGNSVVWNKNFDFTGNGTNNTVNNSTSATSDLLGPVVLHGQVVFNAGGTSLTIEGAISGSGGLTKTGSSPLILSNNNTYAGNTLINVGAMRLAGNASISNSANIIIQSGATLTVTGRVDATFTLVNGQILSGNGVVAGSLVSTAGTTIAPGTNGIGGLTVSNTITLGGNTIMELDQDNKTNDVLNCNGGITYGGTLTLTNIHSALTNGASFKLFKAGSYSGSFASISPTNPATGFGWNTNNLTTGVISVVSTGPSGPTTNATISSVQVLGTNIVLHGINNNVPNTSFHYAVLSSTNISLPLSNWTAIITNPFKADGTFDYTNPIVPSQPRQFLNVKAVP
jgi:fibronectin-binding autotransporter adhesin